MRWIKEHKLLSTILAVIIAVTVVFVVSVLRFPGNPAGSLVKNATVGIDGFFSNVTNKVRSSISGMFSYRELQDEIDRLEEENFLLKMQMRSANLNEEELNELKDLSDVLNYKNTVDDFDIVSGSVISHDGSAFTTIFTVDVGTDDGVEIGNPVLNGTGLVGKVVQTDRKWSKVACLCDDADKVSFRVSRNKTIIGIAYGTLNDELSGYMLDENADVRVGDTLVTSGMGIYPAGLYVGEVLTVNYNPNTLLREITVQTGFDYRSIEKVSIIKQKQNAEQQSAEEDKEQQDQGQ